MSGFDNAGVDGHSFQERQYSRTLSAASDMGSPAHPTRVTLV
jgi:hypothetical protein